MKLVLKAPGNNCLKLKYDKLLSSFAFKFNLRRYTKYAADMAALAVLAAAQGMAVQVDPSLTPG